MMGRDKPPQRSLFYTGINLDKRVRDDHVLRKVSRLVDFAFVYGEVEKSYVSHGVRLLNHDSIDNGQWISVGSAHGPPPPRICTRPALSRHCPRQYFGGDPVTVGTLLGRLAARIDDDEEVRREMSG